MPSRYNSRRGTHLQASRGWSNKREGGKDSKLRERLVFKELQKHRQVRRQQGGHAGVLQDLRDISEREGRL